MYPCTHGDWVELDELVRGTGDGKTKYRVCRKCHYIEERKVFTWTSSSR